MLAAWASLEPVEAEIRSLAAILPLISVGLWALAAAIGRHFGRRALAPLTLMAESARTMPFDDCRLPSPGTGDELEDFAGSFNGLLDRLHVALERQRQFTGQASHQLRTPLAALIAAIEVARRRPRTVARARARSGPAPRRCRPALAGRRGVALPRPGRRRGRAARPGMPRPGRLGRRPSPRLVRPRAGGLTFDSSGKTGIRSGPGRTGRCWASCWTICLKTRASTVHRARRSPSAPGASPAPSSLAVEDRGWGIPAGDLPHVFEPFYRAESARRLGRAGVGLGLAVARRIASTHGGSISAESEPGRGSRFVVRLPRLPEPAVAPVDVESPEVVAPTPA